MDSTKIKELFEQGCTIGMVCEKTGLSKYKITQIKKELGLVKKKPESVEKVVETLEPSSKKVKRELSDDEKKQVSDLYLQGHGITSIAKKLGFPPTRVKEQCSTLSRPKRGEAGYVYKTQINPSKQV